MLYTQDHRQHIFHSPVGKDVLLFLQMHGQENLSANFLYEMQLQSVRKDIKPDTLLGKYVSLQLKTGEQSVREFNGIVTRFCRSGGFDEFTQYRIDVRPWLWLLEKNSDCRIFQNLNIIEIIKRICEKPIYGGLCDIDFDCLQHSYPKWDYCVQYRETDFNFINRLMQKVGIYYYFSHANGRSQMVLVDSHSSHQAFPDYEEIAFTTDDSRHEYGDERISAWEERGQIHTAAVELNDFDFERVQVSVLGGLRVKDTIISHAQPPHQFYDYPGGYTKIGDGRQIASAATEVLQDGARRMFGRGNARGLVPGYSFTLSQHPIADQNQEYLLVRATYTMKADDYETGGSSKAALPFICEFEAIPKQFRYQPANRYEKPLVSGPQTALVVGKAGEEIWTDKYGRIKLQFHWDREGKGDEKSSCWVRVAQNWAGKRWGGLLIPRIGMEVVVEFLEGDPDKPLVTGCVYNDQAMPPYELPAHQTKSTFKTHSSKNGSGFNELRFEDKKGSEEIFMHAEYDFNRVVKHNDSLQVGFGKTPGGQSVSVKLDQVTNVGVDQKITVGQNQTTQVENICIVEAKSAIILKVGDSLIQIEPGGIAIKSAQVDVNGTANSNYHGGPITINGTTVNIN